ncbi:MULTISPECIES: hypothetical protein [unclassified Paraburkholderia]|uniref:hypothetical protein n=1 Tax=unclassified Paraburkholderia TaxID=2615204 RepID=UPI00161B7EAE|nr:MULTISPECIES: hypothetical protein [unclassified Paraburkholderia]MBB5444630.1 hypothetical protein [Paraburkholderia sp. WSM4177]MBB5485454.1 hypothetical protein [Paraburkholderia sp. WSM4180]
MKIADRIISRLTRRGPDFIIGDVADPYLVRWWVIPRNRFFNIYLHRFLRSDDDRALHDHPWSNLSILLRGKYVEHTIAHGGINVRTERRAGDCKLRLFGSAAHRLELTDGECWTLFVTGPRYREWGFHCPLIGWVHWRRFTAADNPGEIGKGCDA